MSTEKKTPTFIRSYEVQLLIDRLDKLAVGEVISYEDVEVIIGGSKDDKRHVIASAQRALMSEKQIVIQSVRGVGLVRSTDADVVKSGADAIARVRSAAERGLKRLACVNYDAMSNDDKTRHNAYASHLGILGECSKPSAIAKIEERVKVENKKLTFDETIKAFRSK